MTLYTPYKEVWSTIVSDVTYIAPTLITDPTHYYCTVVPVDPNEIGAATGLKQVGDYLKDFVGSTYTIVTLNIGGNANRIEVSDDQFTGAGPQSGQYGYIYRSVVDGDAPYLSTAKHFFLDKTALDYTRAMELEILWRECRHTKPVNNTYVGRETLFSSSDTLSNLNTAVGYKSLYYLTEGDYNTGIGAYSGWNISNNVTDYRNITDTYMTYLGYNSTKFNSASLTNSTAVGSNSLVTKSNQIVLGNSSVSEVYTSGTIVCPTIKLTTGAVNGYFWKCTNATTGAGMWDAISGGGSGTVTAVYSGNGMNFLSFSDSGTITLGTPSTCTTTTLNALTASSHTHAITGFEPSLGNPSVTGYVLSSTTAGVRSWIAPGGGSIVTSITSGGGMNFATITNGSGTIAMGLPSTVTPTSSNGTSGIFHSHGISGFELSLGNPAANGYVLSSTTAGVRSWIAAGSGSGTVTQITSGGGMDFSTITSTGGVSLGLPSELNPTTSNGITSFSHTHQVTGFLALTGGTLTGAVTSNNTYTGTNFILNSDRRLKFNIEDLPPAELDIKYKRYKLASHPGEKRFGVVAQDLLVNYPELVSGNYDDGYSVKYIDLLIREVAYLKSEIKKIKNGITV